MGWMKDLRIQANTLMNLTEEIFIEWNISKDNYYQQWTNMMKAMNDLVIMHIHCFTYTLQLCLETNSSTEYYFNRMTSPRRKLTGLFSFFDQRQTTWCSGDLETALPCLKKVPMQLLCVKILLEPNKASTLCILQIMVPD